MEAALSDFHSGRSIAIILKWVVPGRGNRKDSDQELAAAASVSSPRSSAPPGGCPQNVAFAVHFEEALQSRGVIE